MLSLLLKIVVLLVRFVLVVFDFLLNCCSTIIVEDCLGIRIRMPLMLCYCKNNFVFILYLYLYCYNILYIVIILLY